MDKKLLSESSSIDVLSVSMGIQNYGPFMEDVKTGLTSDIIIDGFVINNYTQTVGLQGENNLWPNSSKSFKSLSNNSLYDNNSEVKWYCFSFFTPSSLLLLQKSSLPELALNMMNMGKGQIWINNNNLGRYWNITATNQSSGKSIIFIIFYNNFIFIDIFPAICESCSSESYVGPYNSNQCRTGCGEKSQKYYKLPFEFLKPNNELNELIICDELGAKPFVDNIQMITLTRVFMSDLL